MNTKMQLNFGSLLSSAKKYGSVALKHAPFALILVVLVCYLFVVFRINQLAAAEPTPDAESTATTSTKIPKIDPEAIKQIQALEKNSPDVHSLLEAARNNPFSE